MVQGVEKKRKESISEAILEASTAHDTAQNLPACRSERVTELLWDWALNWDTLDITKVQAELTYLYGEQFAEEKRQQAV